MMTDEPMMALTLAQIIEVFNAGCRRGTDEATAMEWGSHVFGQREDDLADALCEIANEGIGWGEPRYVEPGKISAVWQRIVTRDSDPS